MNASKEIFPSRYTHLDNQAHGECDFVDVVTGEKFDAKIPIDKRRGQMIGSRKGDVSPFQNRSIPSSKESAPTRCYILKKQGFYYNI